MRAEGGRRPVEPRPKQKERTDESRERRGWVRPR